MTTLTDAFLTMLGDRVDAFRARTGMAESTISRKAVGDSDFIGRLRRGENVTLEKVRRLEAWMHHYEAAVAA